MAIINFTDKYTGQASTFETGSGKFLRLEDSQGAVHLFAASEITISGTNGTVMAGQTLDLSTLLTVPPALASKTVSWSKASGSAALTLSGHTVTAEIGATDSDSADFVATVAGISATVTVTAAAAAPATYGITIPTVTGATITVLVNDAPYTSGKLMHGDAVSITVAAQTGYNITSSSVTMGGQPVTGSNGEYNISSVTGAVEISVTVEEITADKMYAVEHDIDYAPTFTFERDFTDDFIEIVYTILEAPGSNSGIMVFVCQKIDNTWSVYAKTRSNAIKDYEFVPVISGTTFRISRGTGATDNLQMSTKDSSTVARKRLTLTTREAVEKYVNEYKVPNNVS